MPGTPNQKSVFTPAGRSRITDPCDRVKFALKKYGRLYRFLVWLISPVYITGHLRRFLHRFGWKDRAVAVNLGSGNTRIHGRVFNIDLFAYPQVDAVADIHQLPFRDRAADLVINVAVLEHVRDPEAVVAEAYRILKPGGIIYSFFPFMQGEHASPSDFTRCTREGIRQVHRQFEPREVRLTGGPTSGFLWVFQEWVAIVLSFGIRPVYFVIHLAVMTLTFPLKFLDVILSRHPMAGTIASGFTFIGVKPGG